MKTLSTFMTGGFFKNTNTTLSASYNNITKKLGYEHIGNLYLKNGGWPIFYKKIDINDDDISVIDKRVRGQSKLDDITAYLEIYLIPDMYSDIPSDYGSLGYDIILKGPSDRYVLAYWINIEDDVETIQADNNFNRLYKPMLYIGKSAYNKSLYSVVNYNKIVDEINKDPKKFLNLFSRFTPYVTCTRPSIFIINNPRIYKQISDIYYTDMKGFNSDKEIFKKK